MNKKPKARVSILPGFELQFTREETQGSRNEGGGLALIEGLNHFHPDSGRNLPIGGG
ncbi:hypothetical protein [Microseira wollei]|uniref:hypothetical protein n=1 Tax=Microseira wollei TaxID=467598 RepID=UPI001CFF0B3D|nr:hypothetical protein [Microseira wollei]